MLERRGFWENPRRVFDFHMGEISSDAAEKGKGSYETPEECSDAHDFLAIHSRVPGA